MIEEEEPPPLERREEPRGCGRGASVRVSGGAGRECKGVREERSSTGLGLSPIIESVKKT